MRWYNRLYVGKRAKKHRFRIIEDIRDSKFQTGAYVITPASNGNNILDIYPAFTLLQPYYKNQENLLILGIGNGYWDALEVARQIIDDMYQATGELELNSWLSLDDNE